MSFLTIAWSAAGAACFTLALTYAFVWLQQRRSKAYLLFSLAALGAAGSAATELALMKARTVEQYALWLKLQHIPIFTILVFLAWFVVAYFGTARRWLAWAVTTAWGVYLLGSLVTPHSLIFREITSLREVTLPWGETFSVAVGEPHPLKFSADLVSLVLLAFFADASWSLWRRGERRRAAVVGGSLVLFLGAAGLHSPLVDVGVLDSPYLISFSFLAVVLAMATELTRDVVRASQLAAEVAANERRWRSLAENVKLLVVGVDPDRRINYVNPFTCEVSGFAAEELVGRSIEEVSPPELHASYLQKLDSRLGGDLPSSEESPLRTRDGKERTILFSTARLLGDEGEVTGIISVGADITEQRQAEAARDEALHQTEAALREVEALKSRLEDEVVQLRTELQTVGGFEEIIGHSDALRYVLQRLEQVAPLETTVLIEGETGVGKELVARAIHARSRRSRRPLVKVDCAALPPNLIETELFGHERGAFTGADRLRRGRFELADGGTLFLDEVGELPLELQGKLLRALQEGEVERVGGERTLTVDVRVIAATNRNLEAEVRRGGFREDLFYRLNVFPLTVPPLRQRREDIPDLIQLFARRYASAHVRRVDGIPQAVMDELVRYDWPGNVRELSNVIERAVITSPGGPLRLAAHLEQSERGPVGNDSDYRGSLQDVERDYVRQVLESSGWRIEGEGGAAELLGLHPNTLRFRMRKLGIQRPVAAAQRSPSPPSGGRGSG